MSELFDRILLLKQSPIFGEISTEDLRVVASELEVEQCMAGDRVFDMGEPSDRLFLIASGKIGISLSASTETKEFIAVLEAGECFGEMGLFDDQPRSATAHALTDVVLFVLDKTKLRTLLLTYPYLAVGLLRSLSLRLRATNAKLV